MGISHPIVCKMRSDLDVIESFASLFEKWVKFEMSTGILGDLLVDD